MIWISMIIRMITTMMMTLSMKMILIVTTILPCLTKPFILLLLLGYLCTIYTQINITVQTKLLFTSEIHKSGEP